MQKIVCKQILDKYKNKALSTELDMTADHAYACKDNKTNMNITQRSSLKVLGLT